MNPGLSPAVSAALARRASSGPIPQLSQVSPQAKMATGPAPQPMPQSSLDKKSTVPTSPKTTAQKYVPQTQTDMVLSALVDQLKSNNALEKEKLKMASGGQAFASPTPQAPQLPMNQPPPANMGSGVFGSPTTTATANAQGGSPFNQSPF